MCYQDPLRKQLIVTLQPAIHASYMRQLKSVGLATSYPMLQQKKISSQNNLTKNEQVSKRKKHSLANQRGGGSSCGGG